MRNIIMAMQQLQANLFVEKTRRGDQFWTKNLTPGETVYDEKLVSNGALRQWSVKKSKLAAGLAKGLKKLPVEEGDVILYLGASSGTTVSHLSDMVGEDGMIFAVEFSFYMLRRLVMLAEKRKNIAPILADANHPERYQQLICEADFLFQDIAQREQVAIFLKNMRFLKQGKLAMLAIKAKSIDVLADPKDVYEKVKKELEKEVKIHWQSRLDPFEKDHCLFVVERK